MIRYGLWVLTAALKRSGVAKIPAHISLHESDRTKADWKIKTTVQCLKKICAIWGVPLRMSYVFLCHITMAFKVRQRAASGTLCFWRFGVRAPFLDGSTVLTNICTDMELQSTQQKYCVSVLRVQLLRKMTHRRRTCHAFTTEVLSYPQLAWSGAPKYWWKM